MAENMSAYLVTGVALAVGIFLAIREASSEALSNQLSGFSQSFFEFWGESIGCRHVRDVC
jgi:hypothetical protein